MPPTYDRPRSASPPTTTGEQRLGHRCACVIMLTAALLLAAACAPDETPEAATPTEVDYPDWLERVYPPPGAEVTATAMVEVNHNVVTSERAVRLLIDGTDVTTYADQESPSLLVYDPDDIAPEPPVELDPREHTAVVELLDVEPATDPGGLGYEVLEVLDTFTWTFNIL